MKIELKTNHLFQALLASSVFFAAPLSMAEIWNFEDINTSNKYTVEPHYFYVGKGSEWKNTTFSTQYATENNTTLLVKYDDKLIYNTTLNGAGQLSFNIPASKSGFHRLDFILQEYSPPTSPVANRVTFCSEDVDQVTYLSNSKIEYTRHRPIYRLKDLPDALFNPQIVRSAPFVGVLKFNPDQIIESSMLARLTSSWSSVTPIRWFEQSAPANQTANFVIETIYSSTPLKGGAYAQISAANELPILQITYHKPEELIAAIHGLINPSYLTQLDTSATALPIQLSAPKWAELKNIKTLADLGIEDFRLNQAEKNLYLDFPAVWQPTDILQGQIALRVQSGLLEGSNITAWIDNGLAGSLKTAELDSDPVNRQFNFFAKTISKDTNFNLRLENSIIANAQCLPNAHGSLWIDANKSNIQLPHKIKNGVSALSMTFASNPTIAIDRNSGALGMAIITSQVAKNMLMTAAPVPLDIVRYSSSQPELINIQVNPNIYRQQVLMHQDSIYQPAAQKGFIVSFEKNRFYIITDSAQGAQSFMRLWGKIQHSIPNNVSKLFVSENGQIHVLQKIIVGNQKAPLVQQSSFFIVVLVISTLLILAIFFWYWRKNRNAKKHND